jgi:hypothetical protein
MTPPFGKSDFAKTHGANVTLGLEHTSRYEASHPLCVEDVWKVVCPNQRLRHCKSHNPRDLPPALGHLAQECFVDGPKVGL